MRNIAVYIEGQRLDLFETESIELNRSVQDIKDISKIYTDFTQSFTVPASKNNNKVFKHFERPEIDNGYDTRIKKDATITINSLDFLSGKIRLESVSVKGNRPTQYKITFFGNLVSLKDLIGDDELKDLDYLNQFNHDFNFGKVEEGLTDAVEFTVDGNLEKVIRYPLLSPVRRWFYDSGADTTDTEAIVNISHNDINQTHGIGYYEFKPAISIYWIIKAIQDKYGITFSGDFFQKPEFQAVHLWLSKDKGYMRSEGNFLLPFEGLFMDNYFFVATVDGKGSGGAKFPDKYTYQLDISPTTSDKYDIILTNFGEPFRKLTEVSGDQTLIGDLVEHEPGVSTDYKIGFYINSEASLIFDATLTITEDKWEEGDDFTQSETTDVKTLTNQTLNSTVKILEQVPEMKISDFLEGLFKMYNLTLIPSDDSIEVSTLEEWYLRGRIIDISEHVNRESVDIEKGTILRQINLEFEEGESFLMDQFVKDYSRGYGDINFILRDEQGRKLDGEELDIKLPFEQVIYERLTDVNTSAKTDIQYGYITDKEQKPYKLKPHLLYIVNRPLTNTIALKNTNNVVSEISTANEPSHIGGLNLDQYSTTFSADYEEYSGNIIANNLLTNYYFDYLTDLFSVKRRVFNFSGKLPGSLLQKIQLNDRLVIDGRRYIINSLRVDLVTKKADLELINDIYRGETQDGLTNKMLLSQYYVEYQNTAGSGSFTYTTNEEQNYLISFATEDIGYGAGWVTPSQNGNTISYTVDANATEADRYIVIKLTARQSTTYFKIMQHA
jgi:hypothetical protein